MTLDQLKSLRSKMTPGKLSYVTVRDGTGESSLVLLYLCIEGKLRKHGCLADEVFGDILDEEEDENAIVNANGLVAQHNAFPVLVERFEAMRAALKPFAKFASTQYAGIALADWRRAEDALALADKPLTEERPS